MHTTYIRGAGIAVVSRRILEKSATIKWINILCNIEPACIGIYDLPIGSDIQLVVEPDGRRRWFDNKAREEIRLR